MDEHQEFILEKLRFGLANKPTPEPMTDLDLERLNWSSATYSQVPQDEWNEWSRKTHWGLQYAFYHDTERLQNIEKLEQWRKHCISAVKDAVERNPEDRIVLDTLTLHFVRNDLLGDLKQVYGRKNLTDEEKKLLHGGRGCLGMVLLVLATSMTLLVAVLVLLI